MFLSVHHTLALTLLTAFWLTTEAHAYSQSKNDCSARCGYIDHQGKFAIQPNFTFGGSFSEGIAWAQSIASSKMKPPRFDAIDTSGRVLFSIETGSVDDFHCGLSRILKDRRYGYIDKTGKFAIPIKFLAAEDFVDDRAKVYFQEWRQRTINTKGEFVEAAPEKPKSAIPAYAQAHVNEQDQLIFDAPSEVGDDRAATGFSEGLCYVHYLLKGTNSYKQGFMDTTRRIVLQLPDQIKACGPFHDGLSPVLIEQPGRDEFNERKTTKLGFINREGAIVIPPIYDDPKVDSVLGSWWWYDPRFREGIALVKWHGADRYIDRQGKTVAQFRCVYCAPFADGVAPVTFLVDDAGKPVDLADNSHGYQNRYDYQLEVQHVLSAALKRFRYDRPIKFTLTESADKPVTVEFSDVDDVSDLLLGKMRDTIQNAAWPTRGIFLQETFKFSFVLQNGALTCNYNQDSKPMPLPPPPLPPDYKAH
jgi:hypothetical protein